MRRMTSPRRRAIAGAALCALAGACHPQPPGAAAAPAAPELYGAGLFSTGAWDFFMAFSPDERHVLFCRANDDFSAYDIYETRRDAAGRWSAPRKPAFAAEWDNADPHFYDDGRAVVFISDRPNPGETGKRATFDIWTVGLGADGRWGAARRLPEPVSDPRVDEWSPSIAANGDLYFGAERDGTRGGSDLWVARRVGGAYGAPENLGDAINTAGSEVEPWIAPDESYLVFSALRRADGVGKYDLYASRNLGGRWQEAQPLRALNTPDSDFNPSVSPDGVWLYFSSTRPLAVPLGPRLDVPRDDAAVAGIGNGQGDIYRVRMSALGLDPRRRR